MVLKRKRDGEFVPWQACAVFSSQPASAQPEWTSAQTSSASVHTTPPLTTLNANPTPSAATACATASALTSVSAPQPPAPAPPARKTRARATPAAKKPRAKAAARKTAADTPTGSASAPPPAKRTRKKKGEQAAEGASSGPEKRGAIFKSSCPQNILDRVERVQSQRFFMISRNRVDGELKETFDVLGSTGNVYEVTIDKKPRCTCPDSIRGNHCKHVLFIFLKVLQVNQSSGVWYQKALLTTELETIFANAPLAPNSVDNPRVRAAYERAKGKGTDESDDKAEPAIPENSNKRIPSEEDDCPICYDGMHGVQEAKLVFCDECGNAVHQECFGQWRATAQMKGNQLTCVWCRASWATPRNAAAGGSGGTKGKGTMQSGPFGRQYLNLAAEVGISPKRDTSSYYHGPRRGERYYGYNDYDD